MCILIVLGNPEKIYILASPKLIRVHNVEWPRNLMDNKRSHREMRRGNRKEEKS